MDSGERLRPEGVEQVREVQAAGGKNQLEGKDWRWLMDNREERHSERHSKRPKSGSFHAQGKGHDHFSVQPSGGKKTRQQELRAAPSLWHLLSCTLGRLEPASPSGASEDTEQRLKSGLT